jgi:hypothetical protein
LLLSHRIQWDVALALEPAFDVPSCLAVPPQHQPYHLVTVGGGRRGAGRAHGTRSPVDTGWTSH